MSKQNNKQNNKQQNQWSIYGHADQLQKELDRINRQLAQAKQLEANRQQELAKAKKVRKQELRQERVRQQKITNAHFSLVGSQLRNQVVIFMSLVVPVVGYITFFG